MQNCERIALKSTVPENYISQRCLTILLGFNWFKQYFIKIIVQQ